MINLEKGYKNASKEKKEDLKRRIADLSVALKGCIRDIDKIQEDKLDEIKKLVDVIENDIMLFNMQVSIFN